MCLIAFAWQADADYPLVVAGNRDEFFARPTASADWSRDGSVLSGRDLRGGGTWMGVARDGRFAALTNHRDPAAMRPDAPSRGELVDRVLNASAVEQELNAIADDSDRFNGFNLIAATWGPEPGMRCVSHPGGRDVRPIEPGVHGLSNARLDTAWPKVEAIKVALEAGLRSRPDRDALIEHLFSALADERIAHDDALPQTGVTRDVERALSAAFIRMPGYGTRSSTVFVVGRDGEATFVERRCEPDAPRQERRFSFRASAVPSS